MSICMATNIWTFSTSGSVRAKSLIRLTCSRVWPTTVPTGISTPHINVSLSIFWMKTRSTIPPAIRPKLATTVENARASVTYRHFRATRSSRS